MLLYLFRRVLAAVPVMGVVALFVFLLLRVTPGDPAAILAGDNATPEQLERIRISLGLKQALGDPWVEAAAKLTQGAVIEGPVTSMQKFGAFVQIAEGVEGMIHVGDISAEKRINHPQDVLKVGEVVKAQVLEVDTNKRRLRLGMKQLVPTSLDEYIAEHKPGDVVTGRMTDVSGSRAKVELGEGVHGACVLASEAKEDEKQAEARVDLSSLSSMLQARWKGGEGGGKAEAARSGQIRSFRITKLDAATKKIELELA